MCGFGGRVAERVSANGGETGDFWWVAELFSVSGWDLAGYVAVEGE
jgi:hypothetical protein